MMIDIDPPRHTRDRTLVNRGFTPRRVATLEPRMRKLAGRAVDAALGSLRCDFEIRGERIRAGERVVLWDASANFDETVFSEPLRFDVCRTPNDHVAFGAGGPHFCPGSNFSHGIFSLPLELEPA